MDGEPTPKKGVDRRELLKSAVVGGALGTMDGLMMLPGLAIGVEYRREIIDFLTDAQHASDESIARTQEFIKAQYGIEVTFGPDYQREDEYRLEGLSRDEARTALSALLISLYKYPPNFFKKHQLPAIRIGKNLLVSREDPMLPGATLFMPYAGLATYKPEEILISLTEEMEEFELYMHHEIHHILEGRHYTQEQEGSWQAIQNGCECGTYAGGDVEPRGLDERLSTVFARDYGAINSAEDRATIAEVLFSVHEHAPFLDRIAAITDTRLRETIENKVKLVKTFYQNLSPEIDLKFWLRIELASRRRMAGEMQGIVVTGGNSRVRDSGFLRYAPEYIESEFQEWYPDLTE